ncbi:MAG: glycosyl hydrolase 53 family protein [Bacteroidota bacterium]
MNYFDKIYLKSDEIGTATFLRRKGVWSMLCFYWICFILPNGSTAQTQPAFFNHLTVNLDIYQALSPNLTLGIKGNAARGSIKVEVFNQSADRALPVGALIYGVQSTQNSPNTNVEGYWLTPERGSDVNSGEFENSLLQASTLADGSGSKFSVDVLIRITHTGSVTSSDFISVDLPGISTLSRADFSGDFAVAVFGSDKVRRAYIFNFGSNPTNALDLLVGDSVVFKSSSALTITGLPEIWLARFAGESKYYCTPSITPGEYRPFLGFDSQVHGVAVRKYADESDIQVPSWDILSGHYYLYWIAQRRMDASKPSYTTSITSGLLDKEKHAINFGTTFSNGFKVGKNASGQAIYQPSQRNNQREGYNMQILHAWYDESATTRNYDSYSGQDYILGLDDDEIIYLNSKDAEVSSTTPLHPSYLLKIIEEEWKEVPTNEGDPIAEMVTAYQKNRVSTVLEGDPSTVADYHGYEIEDLNTYTASGSADQAFNGKPIVTYNYQGSGTGIDDNNKAPGLITITDTESSTTPSPSVDLSFNVAVPLETDYGFYGSLEGEQWPAEYQQGVPYTLKGLSGVDVGILNGLSMEYTHEDELGILTTVTKKFKDGGTVDGNGGWTETFDINGWGYNEITVYYQRKEEDAIKVPIAGKELLEVNTRFLSVPGSKWSDFSATALPGIDLAEGRGEGKFWYLRDFNDDLSNHDELYGDRDYDLSREYTFQTGDEVSFACMDSDPHTFFHYGIEFYISERTMAKRLTDSDIAARLQWYIAPMDYDGDGDWVGNGRNLTYTWSEPGEYKLTADYQGSKIMHKINIVDRTYDNTDLRNGVKGTATIYELSPDQKQWLTDAGNNVTDDYRIAKVEQVFSQYTYADGPRAKQDNSKSNRFGLENDFNAEFIWKDGSSNVINNLSISDPRSSWFPNNWIRHYSVGDYPEDMDATQVSSLLKTDADGWATALSGTLPESRPENWQWRLPWVSTTQWNGYRTRANIKVVIDMNELFDNENGAFSGMGNVKTPDDNTYKNAVANAIPALNGQQKSKYDFYVDLLGGRKLVYDPTSVTSLSVYNPDSDNSENLIASPPTAATNFLKGADMSIVSNLEAGSISWSVDGADTDPYQILQDYGANVARFRLWVNPTDFNNNAYNYSTESDVTAAILRARAKGLKILLDFHYSDTWTDESQNLLPASWPDNVNHTISDLSTRIRNYTYTTLSNMSTSGALPDYVQVGNEINSNILLSLPYEQYRDGSTNNVLSSLKPEIAAISGMSQASVTMDDVYKINWDRNAALINAALNIVKTNFPSVATVLHIAGPGNAEWWANQAFTTTDSERRGTTTVNRSNVDIIGMSYYLGEEDQMQSFSELKSIIERIKSTHGKEVLIAETAFPSTWNYSDNQANRFGVATRGNWPETTSPTTQRDWLISLRLNLQNTDGATGFIVWEPFWVGSNTVDTKDFTGSNWENLTFFDYATGTPVSSNPLNTTGGILAFCEGSCPAASSGTRVTEAATILSVEMENAELKAYPVPAKDILNIQLMDNVLINQVEVLDMTGKRQDVTLLYSDGLLQIDISKLPDGNYITKLHSGNEVINSRFIKMK